MTNIIIVPTVIDTDIEILLSRQDFYLILSIMNQIEQDAGEHVNFSGEELSLASRFSAEYDWARERWRERWNL